MTDIETGSVPPPSAHNVDSAYQHLVFTEEGPVTRIALNRPQARNALSIRLSDELIHALERLRDSSRVKVVVIEGAGGTFCAGDDITEMFRWGNANEIMRLPVRNQREPTSVSAKRARAA